MKTIFKYNLKDFLPTKAISARTVAGGHETNAGELTLAGTGLRDDKNKSEIFVDRRKCLSERHPFMGQENKVCLKRKDK